MLWWRNKNTLNLKNSRVDHDGLYSLLQYEPSPLSNENKISQTVNDNAPIAILDDIWKHSKSRWQTRISVREDVDIRALEPCLIERSVDSLFHVFAVEINRGLYVRERPTKNSSWQIHIGKVGKPYGKPRTSHSTGYYKRVSRGQHGRVEDNEVLTVSKIL